MPDEMRIAYPEFVKGVWGAIRTHQISHTEFTPACVELLGQIKPRLLAKALEVHDPRESPYPLKEFLAFLERHWDEYNRPSREFN